MNLTACLNLPFDCYSSEKIAGLRDVLIHNYMKVDAVEIWGVVENDLDNLKKEIELILQELN